MHAAVMSVNKRHGYAKSPFDQANLIVQAQSQIMHAYPSKVHRHRIFRLDCLANDNCVFVDRGDPPTGVPEPGNLVLMFVGLAGIGWLHRRKLKASKRVD